MAETTDRHCGVRTAAIVTLAIMAAIAGLYFSKAFLLPVAFAVLLQAAFRPIVRRLQGWGIPAPIGAAVIVLALFGAIVAGCFILANPVKQWVANAPAAFDTAEHKLSKWRGAMQQVTAAASKVERVAEGPTTAPSQPAAQPGPGAIGGVLGTTTAILAAVIEVLLLLYLLLAAGGMFLQKTVRLLPRFREKSVADDIVHESESVVLRYLLVTLIINVFQGTLVTLVMWWIGMPTPILWGLATLVLEFVPYLGATVMVGLLSVVGLATFDDPTHMLLAPGSYLLITTIQNNVVSPFLYGRRLKLNPVTVLIGVLFWYFVWGVPGAFLAVPIVATLKVISDRIERMKPLGAMLGEANDPVEIAIAKEGAREASDDVPAASVAVKDA